MASQICWRCLSRLRPTVPASPFQQALVTFSTTAASQALNPQKTNQANAKMVAKMRSGPRLKLKKNVRQKVGKRPEPGERKAIRKRIVLSNTNAFEVNGLEDWSRDNWADEQLTGRVVGLPNAVIDSLRTIDAFKPKQAWNFFRRPATLVRQQTMEIARFMQEMGERGQPETMRRIIAGERGTGKSVLLLQAQAMAFLKGWVVIHIPEAKELTSATTAYAPLTNTSPTRYVQKDYTALLLSQLAKANEPLLSTLRISQHHDLPISTPRSLTLSALATAGATEPLLSWSIFEALWTELTAPSRPPILLTLDGLPYISRPSDYLTPSMHYIHAHDLVQIHHFTSHLSGARSLPNGGIVLAADSHSNRPSTPALDLAIRQNEARQADGTDPAQHCALPLYDLESPWQAIDARSLAALRSVDVMRVGGFTKDEVRVVLEYYARSGMLRKTVTQRFASERWTLAGGGIVGELERSTVRMSL